MIARARIAAFFGLLLVACGGASGGTHVITQDVVVRFAGDDDRSPLAGPSARRAASSRQIRELLGHPLAIEIDAALAPEYRDALDDEITRGSERLATELERLKTHDARAFAAAQKRLGRIVVRYRPDADRDERATFEGDDAVVVTKTTKRGDLLPIGAVVQSLSRANEREQAAAFSRMDPRRVPAEDQDAYLHWLRGWFDADHDAEARRQRQLARIPLAIRFADVVRGDANVIELQRYVIGDVLGDLAYGRLGSDPPAKQATELVARFLESRFDGLADEFRARTLDILLGHGVVDDRLRETAFTLATRIVDAWARAGHPLPGRGASIRRDFELVVCPHPKDERGHRSLGPRCDGGLVRLSLATDAGTRRLGELLAARKDPLLVEHVMVSAGYSTYGGSETKAFTLLRAIENDPASFRAALRVLAEEHASGANVDVWLAEMRRLWQAHPDARGTLLYVLANLDPYGNGKVDFADFARDFGAKVTGDEARAYFAEGPGALGLARVAWPAFAPGFSRAATLRPFLDAYLDDDRARESLVAIRHRLCEEGSDSDLRALSTYFAERARTKPGRGLDDLASTYDPNTCDARAQRRRAERSR